MQLVALDITGFRGVKTGRVEFSNQCVLVGPNNSGKTTVIEALSLLLGRERMIRTYTEHDFFGSNPQRDTRFRIVGTIGGFSSNDNEHHPDWFGPSRAVPKWLNPVSKTLSPEPDSKHTDLVLQLAVDGRFDHDMLEVEVVRYFFDDKNTGDPFADEQITRVHQLALRELGFFLVPANRTWDRMVSFGSDLFKQVVNYVGGRPSEAVLHARDELRRPESPLERDPALAEVIDRIEKELAFYFSDDLKLQLRVTTTDSRGVLESVFPHYSFADEHSIPSRREGSGLISLQTLALLMQFGHLRVERGENFILALEEPEIHVPPPLQKRIVHNLGTLTTQSILTSHSPAVATYYDPQHLILLHRQDGVLTSSPLLRTPLDDTAPNSTRTLLQANRHLLVDALMHRNVLIPEGKTDYYWLTNFSRITDIWTIGTTSTDARFSSTTGVVPTHNSAVLDTHTLLSRCHDRTHCLLDGDSTGKDYQKSLLKSERAPRTIVRWPNDHEIEDIVALVVSKDENVLSSTLLSDFNIPQTSDKFLSYLKSDGKSNLLAHEAIVNAIADSQKCREFLNLLLSEMSTIITAERTDVLRLFEKDGGNSTENTAVWLLTPPQTST